MLYPFESIDFGFIYIQRCVLYWHCILRLKHIIDIVLDLPTKKKVRQNKKGEKTANLSYNKNTFFLKDLIQDSLTHH